MLLNSGGYGKYVGVEYYVAGRNAGVDEQSVCAAAHFYLSVEGVGLSVLVECHHHHRGSHTVYVKGFLDEWPFALLEAYRVDHRATLNAFQCFDYHIPLR